MPWKRSEATKLDHALGGSGVAGLATGTLLPAAQGAGIGQNGKTCNRVVTVNGVAAQHLLVVERLTYQESGQAQGASFLSSSHTPS